MLRIIYFLLILIEIANISSCKKNVLSERKVSFSANLEDAVLQGIRFKDAVFLERELYIERHILYRDSLLDFAKGDSIKRNLMLNFYCPDFTSDTMKRRPLIVWIHGGSFVGDDKNAEINEATCTLFARYGYAVASINYRLNPAIAEKNKTNTLKAKEIYEAVYRAAQDARFAIRFAKKNANSIAAKIDTNKIFIAGLSAGAVTALHATWMNDRDVDQRIIDQESLGRLDFGAAETQSSLKIGAVVSFAGAISDLIKLKPDDSPAIILHSNGDTYFPNECGKGNLYRQVIFCGGKSIANRMTILKIPNAFKPFKDIFNSSPSNPLSHGSIFINQAHFQEKRINPVAIRFMMDNLFGGFFCN